VWDWAAGQNFVLSMSDALAREAGADGTRLRHCPAWSREVVFVAGSGALALTAWPRRMVAGWPYGMGRRCGGQAA
jgi:hypothetical protein